MNGENKKNNDLKKEVERLTKCIAELEDIEITRRYTETKLRDSEERYRSLFDESPVSIWEEDASELKEYLDHLKAKGIKDFDEYFDDNPKELIECAKKVKIVDVNKASLKLYEASSKEDLQKSLSRIFSDESYELFKKTNIAIAEGIKSFEFEAINTTLKGNKKNVFLKWVVSPESENTYSKVIISIIDISDLKRTQQDLKESEEKFGGIAEYSPNMIFINQKGRILYANRMCEEVMGYTREELTSASFNFFDLIDPESKHIIEKNYKKHMMGEDVSPYEYTLVTKSGTKLIALITTKLIRYHGDLAILGIVTDITSYKEIEDILKFERAQLLSIFDSIDEIIYVTDPNTYEVIYVNKRFEESMGKNPIGGLCYKEFQGFDRPCKFCTNDIIKKYPGEAYRWEYHNPSFDRDFMLTDRLIKWPDGRDVRFELAVDITDRKKTLAALKKSEEKYRALIEMSGDAIFLTDPDTGIIVDTNKKAESILGVSREKIIGTHFADLHPDDEREDIKKAFKDSMDGRIDAVSGFHLLNSKNQKIPVHISRNIIETNNGKIMQGIFRDVTDLKIIEDVLRKDRDELEVTVGQRTRELGRVLKDLEDAKRLSDVGTLAATIAHELRNPLGVMKTAVYNIRNKVKGSLLEKHLTNIDKKIFESDQIIKNLLSYSKIKMPCYEDINISSLINECIENVQNRYTEYDVKINKNEGCSDEMVIQADVIHLTELIGNILDNAYQAMVDRKGKIDIKIKCDVKKNEFDLFVSDDGVGIDEKDLVRIIEPFYSKKAKGIGLGLTVCNQVVGLHGGKMEIKSKMGKGTKIKVSMPLRRN